MPLSFARFALLFDEFNRAVCWKKWAARQLNAQNSVVGISIYCDTWSWCWQCSSLVGDRSISLRFSWITWPSIYDSREASLFSLTSVYYLMPSIYFYTLTNWDSFFREFCCRVVVGRRSSKFHLHRHGKEQQCWRCNYSYVNRRRIRREKRSIVLSSVLFVMQLFDELFIEG